MKTYSVNQTDLSMHSNYVMLNQVCLFIFFFSLLENIFLNYLFLDSNIDLRKSNEFSPERTKKSGPQNKEYIKHITKDLIREIL